MTQWYRYHTIMWCSLIIRHSTHGTLEHYTMYLRHSVSLKLETLDYIRHWEITNSFSLSNFLFLQQSFKIEIAVSLQLTQSSMNNSSCVSETKNFTNLGITTRFIKRLYSKYTSISFKLYNNRTFNVNNPCGGDKIFFTTFSSCCALPIYPQA